MRKAFEKLISKMNLTVFGLGIIIACVSKVMDLILGKLSESLKDHGVVCVSFKYREDE